MQNFCYYLRMKNFLFSVSLLVIFVLVPCIFAGCRNSNNSENNSSSPSDTPKIEVLREFRFEALNNFENINYDFNNNRITLSLDENSNKNVVNFSAKIFNDNKLESKQSIIYSISNSEDIEIVNCKFTNVYLKFNKVGTYVLKLTDDVELLNKTLTIIVE